MLAKYVPNMITNILAFRGEGKNLTVYMNPHDKTRENCKKTNSHAVQSKFWRILYLIPWYVSNETLRFERTSAKLQDNSATTID